METNEQKLARLERTFHKAAYDLTQMKLTGSTKAVAHAEWLVRKAYSDMDDAIETIKYNMEMRLGNMWAAAREAYDY